MKSLSPTALGIALALVSYGLYATGDALVKGVGERMGMFEIGLLGTLFSILPALAGKPKDDRWRDTFKFNRPWLVHLVGVTRTASAVLVTYSFLTIPLAEVYCIIFMLPLFTTSLSVLILREKVSLTRWALVLLSFVGVLIMVRPGFRELQLGHLTAVGCAILAAASVIATRLTSGNERRLSLFVMPLLYTLLFNAAMLSFGFTLPAWGDVAQLFVCGIIGGVGYLLQIAALERAPASRIAPMQYSQIVWALIYGALFFSEFPDAIGLVGLVVVVIAGLANIFADGARARIAGRWAAYRGRTAVTEPTGYRGPGPDPV